MRMYTVTAVMDVHYFMCPHLYRELKQSFLRFTREKKEMLANVS